MVIHPADVIDLLQNTSSSKKKLEILSNYKNVDRLDDFFLYALSYKKVFNIRKIPVYTKESSVYSLDDGFQLLDALESRATTGNAAIALLSDYLSNTDEKNASLIIRIIKKDPNCGVDYKTVNKVWKNLIDVYPVALCEKSNEKNKQYIKFPAYCQEKFDGLRINIVVNAGAVECFTRNGKNINLMNCLDDDALLIAGGDPVVLDGEAICIKDGEILPRKISNGILNKAIKGTITKEEAELVHVVLWDMIPIIDFNRGIYDVPYKKRIHELSDRVIANKSWKISVVQSDVVNSWDDVMILFYHELSVGHEGVIVKDMRASWENKRLRTQIKLKAENDADLLCVGTTPHSKKPGMIGSLILTTSDGLLSVECGSGLTDDLRKQTPEHFVGKIVEITYNEIISSEGRDTKSLFLPIFKTVRVDKSEANSLSELK